VIELAAILSFPKSPWAMTSPIYHDAPTFNEITSKTFISRSSFDDGLYSEPFAIANLLYDYSKSRDKKKFIWKHRVAGTRIQHLSSTVQSLKQRVASYLDVKIEVLEVEKPPHSMHPSKLNILRIIQVWAFSDSIITQDTSKTKLECFDGRVAMEIDGPPINRDHLLQVLDAERHPFEIVNTGKTVQSIRFDYLSSLGHTDEYFDGFDNRLISYLLERNIGFSFYTFGEVLKVIVQESIWNPSGNNNLQDIITRKVPSTVECRLFLENTGSGNKRGKRGRACGLWKPCAIDSTACDAKRVIVISCQIAKSKVKELRSIIQLAMPMTTTLLFNIVKSKKKVEVSIEVSGEGEKISDIDLKDMFEVPDLIANVTKSTSRQSVLFSLVDGTDREDSTTSSKSHSLFDDAPEGARLLAVLASGRRKDHFIRFSDGADNFIDINLPKKLLVQKWKRKEKKAMVFVPENSVPTALIPTKSAHPSETIFGCCANTLDLAGGSCRVDGVTLLPSRLFTGLALLSFGIHPRTGLSIDSSETSDDENDGDERALMDAIAWIFDECSPPNLDEKWRFMDALEFHASCMDLGEELECQPDKIRALCALFDGVSGSMELWDGYNITLSSASAALRNTSVRTTTAGQQKSVVKVEEQQKSSDNERQNSQDSSTIQPDSVTVTKDVSLDREARLDNQNARCQKESTFCPGMGSSLEDAITLALASSPPEKNRYAHDRWLCQGCNETFATKKRCTKHVRECQKVEMNSAPKLVFICPGCNKQFSKRPTCLSHTKACSKIHTNQSVPHQPSSDASLHLSNPSVSQDQSTKLLDTHSRQAIFLKTWVCAFVRKKKCIKHTQNCAEEKAAPRKVFVCSNCNRLFDKTSKKSHTKVCTATATYQDVVAAQEVNQSNVAHTFIPVPKPAASHSQSNEIKREQECHIKHSSWACPGCKNTFAKKKECTKHAMTCTNRATGESSAPALAFTCPCCKEQFVKGKEFRLHRDACITIHRSQRQCSSQSSSQQSVTEETEDEIYYDCNEIKATEKIEGTYENDIASNGCNIQ
jgi:hypothetical protein